ncbi:hypothetical protein PQX77_003204, partial [Marasmius sp. AFHP31]
MNPIVNKVPSSLSEAAAYTAVDGQVGAWVENGKFFVTSPNTNDIYQPLFGSRDVFLRQDYRFGAEDPLLYPQPFISDRCHWAAIPRQPSNPQNSRAKWWVSPPPEAFVQESDSAVKGLGRWTKDFVSQYEPDCDQIRERVSNYQSSQPSAAKVNPVVPALEGQLERTLRYLLTMPLPLHQARQLWSFFQRWYLELMGALDWLEMYKPIMDGRSPLSETTCVKAAVTIGAFLTSVKDCEFFFIAGLPFWFVRSTEHHPTTRVDEEAVPITPESLGLCFDDIMSHRKDILYHGPLRDLKKATAVERFGMAIVDFGTDPFSVPVDPSSVPVSVHEPSAAPFAGPSRTKKNRKQQGPYNKNNSKASKAPSSAQVERDKFAEVRGPFSPLIPDVWVQALASIDKTRRPTKAQVVNGGYAFPDPGMILYAPPEKMQRLLRNWLRLRAVLTFRHCMQPCIASSAWSTKEWRVLLGTTDDHAAKEGSFMAERRSAIRDLLGQCLDFYGLKYQELEATDSRLFTWNSERYGIGQLSDTALVQQITWELYELNFRFEFHALDRKFRATTSSSLGVGEACTFNPDIQLCFPNAVSNPSQIDLKKSNCGLAAAQAKHCAHYFCQMCRVLKDWPRGADAEKFLAGKEKLKDYTDDEIVAMERWATKFYCQTFYEKFGRPPVLPHCLDFL